MGLDSETRCSKNGLEPAAVLDLLSKANCLGGRWDPFFGCTCIMLVFFSGEESSIAIMSILLCSVLMFVLHFSHNQALLIIVGMSFA